MLSGVFKVYTGTFLYNFFGFLNISIYGLFALFAVIIFLIATSLDRQRHTLLSIDRHITLVTWLVFAAIFGARLLNVLSDYQFFLANPDQILRFWDGGLSSMGGIIAVILAAVGLTRQAGIGFLAYADLVAIYAPLLQAIARLGCFFVGCCYGLAAASTSGILVIYKNPLSWAPHNVLLYPAQLYSAGFSILIFLTLFGLSRHFNVRQGAWFCTYLILEGLARGYVDIWRGERAAIANLSLFQTNYSFTVAQLLAGLLAMLGLLGLIWIYFFSTQPESTIE